VVFHRHVLSIMFFIIAYAYFFVSAAIDWYKEGNEQFDQDWVYLNILKVIFVL
jgi:hypothetical protein